MNILDSKLESQRIKIINFLQWNDPDGSYIDEECIMQELPVMTYEDAVKYFFGVVNDGFYDNIEDSIFEIPYEDVVLYAKKNTFYGKTIQKLELLTSNDNPTVEFYRNLI